MLILGSSEICTRRASCVDSRYFWLGIMIHRCVCNYDARGDCLIGSTFIGNAEQLWTIWWCSERMSLLFTDLYRGLLHEYIVRTTQISITNISYSKKMIVVVRRRVFRRYLESMHIKRRDGLASWLYGRRLSNHENGRCIWLDNAGVCECKELLLIDT